MRKASLKDALRGTGLSRAISSLANEISPDEFNTSCQIVSEPLSKWLDFTPYYRDASGNDAWQYQYQRVYIITKNGWISPKPEYDPAETWLTHEDGESIGDVITTLNEEPIALLFINEDVNSKEITLILFKGFNPEHLKKVRRRVEDFLRKTTKPHIILGIASQLDVKLD